MAAPYRQIRADYDDETITVYQAYNVEIAKAAVAEQKLNASPKFRPTRMTWVKPSWAWMLYRAGYSYKDPGQARILALKMKHSDFLSLLDRAVLTTHPSGGATAGVQPQHATEPRDPGATANRARGKRHGGDENHREKSMDVKVQWDPERTVRLERLAYRSIQIGIPGAISEEWVESMIAKIEDVTDKARQLKQVLEDNPEVTDEELVHMGLVPVEKVFEVPEYLRISLRMEEPASAEIDDNPGSP